MPFDESVGALAALRDEGKIRHVGLSNVSVERVRAGARASSPIVSVQNLYNLDDRQPRTCWTPATASGIGFIPWYPLATGELARNRRSAVLGGRGRRHAVASGARLAAARSPVMLPIPGTSSIAHLEENVAAASLRF